MGKKAYPLQTLHKSMMMCFPAVCPSFVYSWRLKLHFFAYGVLCELLITRLHHP